MKHRITNKVNHINRREALAAFGTAIASGLLGSPEGSNRFLNSSNNKAVNDSKLKTIGILGGIGPQATMQLESYIHLASQRLITPLYNSGYPPMIVIYHRKAPVLLNEDLTPVFPLQPDPGLLKAAEQLGTLADFVIIPSNGVHAMQKEIEQAAGCSVVSMIDAVLDEVKRKGWKRVGVIGYKNARIYTERLADMGIAAETIDETLQEKFDVSVRKVMEGRDDTTDGAVVTEIIEGLEMKKVDGVIPGCTELPILLGNKINDPVFINPAALLAETAVKYAIGV